MEKKNLSYPDDEMHASVQRGETSSDLFFHKFIFCCFFFCNSAWPGPKPGPGPSQARAQAGPRPKPGPGTSRAWAQAGLLARMLTGLREQTQALLEDYSYGRTLKLHPPPLWWMSSRRTPTNLFEVVWSGLTWFEVVWTFGFSSYTLQYNPIQCTTIRQYDTIQYNTIQYNRIRSLFPTQRLHLKSPGDPETGFWSLRVTSRFNFGVSGWPRHWICVFVGIFMFVFVSKFH